MNELKFVTRGAFRKWLQENAWSSAGAWLLFGKPGGPETLTADEALEEALCFGWFCGKANRLDEKTYKKYFSPRPADSKWSPKSKALIEDLERRGMMTDLGRQAIEAAKAHGQWGAPRLPDVTEDQIAFLGAMLKGYEPACTNFKAMPPEVKRAYTQEYFKVRTSEARLGRLALIIDYLDENRRSM